MESSNKIEINILIIEDSEVSLHLIKRALTNKRYKIQAITSGIEAFKYLLKPKITPDVILLDNQLPDMDGLEILKNLKTKREDYAFIFLTVDDNIDTVIKAMKLGALDFIVKSENLKNELHEKIKKVYQIHQNRIEKIKSEAKFKNLYEKSGDAILIIENGIFIDCNQATVKMLNYSTKGEFLNTHPSKLSPKLQPDGKKSIEKAEEMMRIALKKGTHRFEWLHTKSNGEIFRVEVLLTAISDKPNNKVIHCVWRDITERKKSEIDLIKLNTAINNSVNEVYIFDATSLKFSYANKGAIKNLGYTLDTLKTMSPINIKPEFTYNSFTKTIFPLKNGTINKLRFETINQRKDKTTYPVEVNLSKFTIDNNSYLLALVIDLTKRKQEEQKRLEEVETTNHFLQESQSVALLGYYIYDFNKKLWDASKTILDLMELKLGKGSLKSWINIIHPEDKHLLINILNKRLKNDDISLDLIYRVIKPKDGKVCWIHQMEKTLKRDDKGNLLPVLGVIQDITEQKLTKEKLKNSELKLKEAEEITQLGTFVFNDYTNLFETSPILDDILGLNKEYKRDIQGWVDLVHPEDYTEVQRLFDNKVDVNVSKEFRIIRPSDHKIIWILGFAKKENDYKGVRNRISGTVQDITRKKLGEQALHKAIIDIEKSEAKFKNLYEKSSDAILINSNGVIVDANQAAIKMFNYKGKADFLNLHPSEFSPEFQPDGSSSFDLAEEYVGLAIKNGSHRFEWIHTKSQGEEFPAEILLTCISNEPNNQIIHAVMRDITERYREAQIREVIYNITKEASESLNLERLFNFIKLELGKLINTNNFFIALYDKKTELISTPYMVDEKDDGDDFPKGKTLTGYIIDTNKSILANNAELLDLKQDHKIDIIGPLSKCFLGVPLMIENETIGAIVVQSYTDEKAYSQKDVELIELVASNIGQTIKQSRDFEQINLLNQALVQSPEIILVTNFKGQIEYVNPAFTKLSGYTAQEVLGKFPSLYNADEQDPKVYKYLLQSMVEGKPWMGELVKKCKDGTTFLVSANVSPVKNKAGIITNFMAVEEDITEKRKLEHDFIHAFIDAQEQEKQTFGEELHDGISQILVAQAMYINLLIAQNKDCMNDKTKFLINVKELNKRATDDTRNIAHGLMSKQLKENGLLKAAAQICKDYNQSKNIEFNYAFSKIKENEISKEIKIQLYRIVQETSTNIIRHSEATKAEINLTKTDKNKLILVIKDNGIGIDLHNNKEGAGLKNIKRRITLLNGEVNIDTAPNKGACYTIIIPLDATEILRHNN